ncbi:hypothetical protein [Mesorhizobium sp. CAU 1741]|uniref:hypothetical protein n=1 Tax=Mesorhizobium sp. CAU 1741 TaxID=3140366 RepID=UPI00325C2538
MKILVTGSYGAETSAWRTNVEIGLVAEAKTKHEPEECACALATELLDVDPHAIELQLAAAKNRYPFTWLLQAWLWKI